MTEGPNRTAGRIKRTQLSSAISGTIRGRANIVWPFPEAGRGESPEGPREGTESSLGDALCRTPGYSHIAEPAEPPYAEPLVRWCGKGGQATVLLPIG